MATPFAHLDLGGLSDTGRCRPQNEDAIVLLPESGIFCVSDGLGGHVGGEIASQAVVDGLRREQPVFAAEPAFEARCVRIRESLQKTNAWILDQASRQNAKGMGATVVVLAFDPECPGQALVLHAGDSRGYRFRNGQLTPLTMDHNMGNLLGEKKDEISAKLAGALTHAVGIAEKLELSEMKVTVEGNDLFLLCSDGLYKMLPDSQIATLLQASGSLPAAQLAQQLVAAANEAGGRDNVSVIVIKAAVALPASAKPAAPVLEELQAVPLAVNVPKAGPATSRRSYLPIVAIVGLAILLLALVFGWQQRRHQAELANNNRKGFEAELTEAYAAFDQQDYDQARLKTQAAAGRFAAGSDEGMVVRELQEKIATDQFDRNQRFETAIALAAAAQVKGDLATAQSQARTALDLFSKGRPEWQRAQALLDQLNETVQANNRQRQTAYATAITAARTALESQDYAKAWKSANLAATFTTANSPDAETAKTLLARAEAGMQEQRQRFTTALELLDKALANHDLATARQQATVAARLCQPDSPDATRLRDANDRIEAEQQQETERRQQELQPAVAQPEKAAAPSAEPPANTPAEKAAVPSAEPPAKPLSPIDQAKALLDQQNYAEARKVIETAIAKAAPGTPEAETAKALLAQVEAGEQLMQQSMRFEAVLAVTRNALAQKDLVTAKKQADLALAIFPPGTPEWQQAQALANHIAKTGNGAVPPPGPPATEFGLIGLFKGKAGIPDLTNNTCYLRVNLWNDPATRISTTNYHKGTMIPAGTQVKIIRVNVREILFSCTATGTQYTVLPSRHVRESLQALQHRYFSEQNPLQAEAYQRLSKMEKDAIREGKIFKNMGKEAVLMAYGYPPSHKTLNLELNAWFYWIDARNFEVDFQNGKVAELKERPAGLPPATF